MHFLAQWILRCYPCAWRKRYEQEMLLILRDVHITLWTLLDLLLGALDARLHPDLLPERMTTMPYRLRNSEIVLFCSFIVYGVAWFALRFVRDPLPQWEAAVGLNFAIYAAFIAMDAFGLLALVALVMGGLPILYVALRSALRSRSWRQIALFAVPFVSVGILAVCALLLAGPSTQRNGSGPNAPLTPLAVVLQFGLLLLLFATIIGSTWAIALLVRRSQFSERLLRVVFVFGCIMTCGIVGGLIASVTLVWLILTRVPEIAGSPGNVEVAVVVMFAAAVLAVNALLRGMRAMRVVGA